MSGIVMSHLNLLAYLDGGTGSMLLQAAIAGILSVAFIAKTRWAQFRGFVAARLHKGSDHKES